MAQTAVLAQVSRQGTITSASATIPDGITQITAQLDIHPNDRTDPTLTISLRAFVSMDGGANFVFIGGIDWRGNPSGRDPQLGLNELDRFAGGLIRVEVDIPVAVRVGATVIW